MTGEQIEKARFVEDQLRKMLITATGQDVIGARYTVDEETGEERVVLLHIDGYKRGVCVTGDSLLAIAGDVLAEL